MDRPRSGQHLRIVHRHVVVDLLLVDACVALGDVQRVGMKRPGAGQPGLIVEANRVHDQRVAVPAPDRIPHVGRNGIAGMGRVQRDDPEHAHVLVEHHDLGWRLHDLNREQAHERNAWQPERQAQSSRIVDPSPVVRLEHSLRGPRLVRAGALMTCCDAGLGGADGSLPIPPTPRPELACSHVPRGRCRPARHPSDRACRRPCAAPWTVSRGRFSRRGCPTTGRPPRRRDDRRQQKRPPHGTLTAGTLPPSPVPAGGPKNSFVRSRA